MRHYPYFIAIGLIAMLQSTVTFAATTELHFTKPTGTFTPSQYRKIVPVGNLADQLFQKVTQTELMVEQNIANAMRNTPEISKFYSADLDMNNLRMVLSYSGSQVLNGRFEGLTVATRIGVDGVAVFCPTLKLDIVVRNIVLTAQYNFFTSNLTNLQVDYQSDIKASCTGVLGLPVINKAVSYFAADKAKAQLDDSISAAMQGQMPIQRASDLAGLQPLMENQSVISQVQAVERQLAMPILNVLDQMSNGMNVAVGLHRNAQGNGAHVIHFDSYFSRPVIYFDQSIRTYSTHLPAFAGSEIRQPNDWTAGLLRHSQSIKSIAFHRLTNFPSYPAVEVVQLGQCGKACE
jgi:hypothetical protein